MIIFEIFLKLKSDPNILQSAPNCTVLKCACRFATCILPNLKNKKLLPPPPCQILATPLWTVMSVIRVRSKSKNIYFTYSYSIHI